MANAAVTTLINRIVGSSISTLIDSAATDNYQNDVILEIARGAFPGFLAQTDAAFIALTRNTVEYDFPSGFRLPLMICFDDTQLAHARFDEALNFSQDWRNTAEKPIAFIQDPVDRDKFEIIPPSNYESAGVAGTPLAPPTPWPTEALTFIGTESNTLWAESCLADTHLALAFEVIAREFSRDSDHKDSDLAALAKSFASIFWQMSFAEGMDV